MDIHVFTFNPFQENTYVVALSGKCLIIDPGMSNAEEERELFHFLEARDLTPVMVLNTHCHLDHILGNAAVLERFPVPLAASPAERPMLERAPSASIMWGVPYRLSPDPDVWLNEGDEVQAGELSLSVLEVPGHSPGHVAFYHSGLKRVFSGDVLFRGSVGRTDLPGCDARQLVESIREKLYTLPDDVVVYPGHGPETTIGEEKKTNPFVRA